MKTKEMPSYVILRHSDGALCLSIRDLDRDQVIGGLLALADFFAAGEPYEEREIVGKRGLSVIHPGHC